MADDTSIFIGASRKPDDSYQRPEATASQIRQPPRPGDRRHRHRQDGDAAGPRRGLFQRRRAGVLRRHQGRPFGHRDDGRGQGFPRRARRGGEARPLRVPGIPGDLLGSVRRAGPPDPRDRFRDGAAAAVAADEPHRGAGRRHQHRLPHRRRRGAAASRPEGSAGAARQHRRARRRDQRPLRQRHQAVGRRDPAHAADPRAAGRREFLRRAGAEDRRHHAHHARRPRRDQRACRRQADDEPAALRDLPALADVGAVRGTARGRRSRQAEAGVLLRRGASAVRRRAEDRSSTGSSRWCA